MATTTVSYIDEKGILQTVTATIVTSGDTGWGTAGATTYYVVNADTAISNTVTVTGDVKLILADGFTLTVTAAADSGAAGVTVTNTDPTATTGLNTFTVYGQTAGSGQLIATGDAGGAGIGGGAGVSGSHITLAGGTVVATGGMGAAGIGGGRSTTTSGHGTDILITGGTVIARGDGGAGIGGGYRAASTKFTGGTASRITITGGVVDAGSSACSDSSDTHCGAGIGGGYGDEANGSNITISGGTVIAVSAERGAGIGGGGYGCGGGRYHIYNEETGKYDILVSTDDTIFITGGTVTASSVDGAAIGGGYGRSASNVTISGGTVTASSTNGDAIGSGKDGIASANIYVNTEVTLKAGTSSAETTEIAHTTGTDVAVSLAGLNYANAATPAVSYVDENGEIQTIRGTLVTGSTTAVTWTTGYYVVGADYNGDGVINAEDAALGTNTFTLTKGATVSGDVKLIVADGFTLTVASSAWNMAAIRVHNDTVSGWTADNTFSVFGQTAGTGVLNATANYGAAIGGNISESGSHVFIHGGTVNASSNVGAGIGGGSGLYDSCYIKITGGVVNATGGTAGGAGSGIGGGDNGTCSNIAITGGTVNAIAQGSGSGIGGSGAWRTGSNIAITGGKVNASSVNGFAIGGGTSGTSSNITVGADLTLMAGASEATMSEIGHSDASDVAASLKGQKVAEIEANSAIVRFIDENGETQYLGGTSSLAATYKKINASGSTAVTLGTAGETTYYVVGADYNNDGFINAADAALGTNSFTISKQVTIAGDVKLIVADGFTLTVQTSDWNTAAIRVHNDDLTKPTNFFSVYGQTEGSGTLNATATNSSACGAAIGGNHGETGSEILIAGCTVNATTKNGAAIGGGNSGAGSNITIKGGVVNATATGDGSAIGGGSSGEGSVITISGGTVNAEAQGKGAGIGGGNAAAGSNITISGGTVTANSVSGAGIGGGIYRTGSYVNITGGTVTASSTNGSAIGSGQQSATGSNITVSGERNLQAGTTAADTVIEHTSTTDVASALAGKNYASAKPFATVEYLDENGASQSIGSGSEVASYQLISANGTTAVTWGTAGETTYYVVGYDYNNDGVINAEDAALGTNSFTISKQVTIAGDVKLIVADGFSLTVQTSDWDKAAIRVHNDTMTGWTADNMFSVYGQSEGSGTLTAKCTSTAASGAAIGGNQGESGSHVFIHGGTVNASSRQGAGIGGGSGNVASGYVEITGGVVNAIGGSSNGGTVGAGSGIGGGDNGTCSNVTITGGVVNAEAMGSGSGIGASGSWRAATNITITGGKVTASSASASAIGGGASVIASSSIKVHTDASLVAGADAGSATAVEHTTTTNVATALNGLKYAATDRTTVAVSGAFSTDADTTYTASSGSAFSVEAGGTLSIAKGTKFAGNDVAIVNGGTVSITGAFALAGESDTLTNSGTLNWDLTAGSATNLDFSVSDWSKVTGSGTLTVTTAAAQYTGTYALAKNVTTGFDVVISGNTVSIGSGYTDTANGKYYELLLENGTESLRVSDVEACGTSTHCDGAATRITDGSNAKMFFGGSVCTTAFEGKGSSTVSIAGGTFAKSIASGSAASGCAVQQTGNLDLTIEGGTYSQRVAGGMYAADTEEATSAELTGNVTLTIKGGTFTGRIYGGSNAKDDDHGDKTTIVGDVNVTVDSSASAIYIGNYLVGGSRGKGAIDGNVTVTFTGFGSDTEYVTAGKGLTFNGGTSVVAGGCNGDTVKIDAEGTRTTSSTVTGSRNLVFDDFDGNFDADLRLFSTATFKNGTDVTFTDTRVNLWTVETWNFEYGSSLSGLLANDFEGDTINFDVTGWTTESNWTVATGDVEAFDDLADAAAVYFGDSLAVYDSKNGCWRDDNYKLALNDDKNAMIVSKIA